MKLETRLSTTTDTHRDTVRAPLCCACVSVSLRECLCVLCSVVSVCVCV